MSSKEDEINYWNAVADDYLNRILSPFYDDESKQSFFDLLDSFEAANSNNTNDDNNVDSDPQKPVLDLGCGKGFLLPKLYAHNKYIFAVDFSDEMIKHCEQYCAQQNVPAEIASFSYTEIPFADNCFSRIYAINSIISADPASRRIAFSQVSRMLCSGGLFYGLFPSTESFVSQANGKIRQQIAEGSSELDAVKAAYSALAERKFDPLGGYIDVSDDQRMKLFLRSELESICDGLGLVQTEIVPFHYHEKMCKALGLFVANNEVYDWFVCARKK